MISNGLLTDFKLVGAHHPVEPSTILFLPSLTETQEIQGLPETHEIRETLEVLETQGTDVVRRREHWRTAWPRWISMAGALPDRTLRMEDDQTCDRRLHAVRHLGGAEVAIRWVL
jgi:hypothetical protein